MPPTALPYFTETQCGIVLSHLPALKALVDDGATTNEITKWKKKTVHDVVNTFFPPVDADARTTQTVMGKEELFTRKQVKDIVDRYYLNQKNKGVTGITTISMPGVSKANTVDTSHTPATPGEEDSRLLKILRALIVFQGQYPARELFAYESTEKITQEIARIRSITEPEDFKRIDGAPVRQTAITNLYTEEQQVLYQQKIREMEGDHALNQSEFPDLLVRALQDICDQNCLGPVSLAVMYAFRKPSDNLDHGILYAGHDPKTKTPIKTRLHSHEELLETWAQHSDTVLPRLAKSSVSLRFRVEDSLPLLPRIDSETAVVAHLRQLLAEYLSALWFHTWPSDSEILLLPYADITSNPGMYYDVSKFAWPVPMQNPRDMPRGDLLDRVFPFLSQLCDSSTPFQFFKKEEIIRRIGEAAAEKQQELEKDDENLDVELTAESPVPEDETEPGTQQPSPAPSTSSHLRDMEGFNDIRAPSPEDSRIDVYLDNKTEGKDDDRMDDRHGGKRRGRGAD
ncbi:hypothetical protein H1R20_g11298, partial [Candolleomyces eurysporus]